MEKKEEIFSKETLLMVKRYYDLGEEFVIRDIICDKLSELIDKSNKGEVGIKDFILELNNISKESTIVFNNLNSKK